MTITELPAAQAHRLVPLTQQVQAVHSAAEPDRYVTDPDPQAVARFLEAMLSAPGMTALVAGPPEQPTGYAILEIVDRPASALQHAERRAVLHHICVDAAHRRQGIARALIAAVRVRAQAADADRLWTSYAAHNAASAALMTSAGLVPSTIFASAPLS